MKRGTKSPEHGAVVVALALCTVGLPAFAQRLPLHGEHHVLPCRPTIACTADIVTDGAIEVELGIIGRRIGGMSTQFTTPYLLKLTLASWVQLQVGGNGWVQSGRDRPARYFDDVTIGPKFHLLDQTARLPSVSVGAELSVPTLDPQLGYLRTYDVFATAYVTKDFGWLHVDLNFGANVWRLEGAPIPQGFVALALSTGLPHDLGAMLEAYYFSDAAPIALQDGGILSAVTWSPRTWLTFDMGTDVGWFRTTRAFSVFAGMTVIVADLWDTPAEVHALLHRRL